MMPLEMCVAIFSFVPEEEQKNLAPVCKAWYSELRKKVMTREHIKLYANKILKSKSIKFEERQIDHIVSLLLNSSILTSLKQIPRCPFNEVIPSGDVRCLIHKKTDTHIYTRPSLFGGASECFDVIWNSGNLKVEVNTRGKRGDFSSQFCSCIRYSRHHMTLFNFTFQQLHVAYHSSNFIYKQAGRLNWSLIDKEQLVPKDMPELIKGMLNVKLHAYIERLARLNLTALACFSNLQDFENLKCLCDERGVITQSKDTPFSFSLKLNVFKSREGKTVELLDWIADDFSDDHGSLKDVLRWVVISATADEVAKKFGIQLELKELGFS